MQSSLDSSEQNQPDDLAAIRNLRPSGLRTVGLKLDATELEDRVLGALLGRAAGCILGIPCEGMSKQAIEDAASRIGQPYPLDDYWHADPKDGDPQRLHYGITPRGKFLKTNLEYIGADDDLAYTILGLLILEEYGFDFSPADVGQAWLKYLPMACTAEAVALENLRQGLHPPETAMTNNPYAEWIGAAIRADPWGYVAPGLPELAAELAWRDATVSHIRNGIYGEMFWAATIAAAFACDDIETALQIGLTEIPQDCDLAQLVSEALSWCKMDGDWATTVDRVYSACESLHPVHTINNAALTVAGLIYGGGDFERVITLTVMAGLDTDCTGATAGSVAGAMLGARRLPDKWIKPLGDRMETYLDGCESGLSARDVAARFTRLALQTRSR